MPRIRPSDHSLLDESSLAVAKQAARVHEKYITDWDINLAEKWSLQAVERKKA